jgi:hypothetical protein
VGPIVSAERSLTVAARIGVSRFGTRHIQSEPRRGALWAGERSAPVSVNSLLIENIHTLVLMDAQNQVLRGAYLYAENGEIRRVGSGTARLPKAGRVIEARQALLLRARALWGGGPVCSRRLAHGDSGGRAMPGPRRYR